MGAVVVAFDQHFSYLKLVKATTYLTNPNCLFLAIEMDATFPWNNKVVYPAAGPLVKAVMTSSGREPVFVGKPGTWAFELISKLHGLVPERVLMIGDRYSFDYDKNISIFYCLQ